MATWPPGKQTSSQANKTLRSLFLKETLQEAWGDSLVVGKACSSSGGPEFESYHLYQVVYTTSDGSMGSNSLFGTHLCMYPHSEQRHICTHN